MKKDQIRKFPFSKAYAKNELKHVYDLLEFIDIDKKSQKNINVNSVKLIKSIRARTKKISIVDKILSLYKLSNEEGLSLMRLAEAYERCENYHAKSDLLFERIEKGDWKKHLNKSKYFEVNIITFLLFFTKGMILILKKYKLKFILDFIGVFLNLFVFIFLRLFAENYVFAQNIPKATKRAKKYLLSGYDLSFDMLGEAAMTYEDAADYYDKYNNIIHSISAIFTKLKGNLKPHQKPSISIKLSAIHPRFEILKKDLLMKELYPKLLELCVMCKKLNLDLTIDAEEVERLEITIYLFTKLLEEKKLSNWDGLGIVIQAYQKSAFTMIDYLEKMAKENKRKINIRLVKGAYWDQEIKFSKQNAYPFQRVFTKKRHTDISYLACVKKLFSSSEYIFPQFATHNINSFFFINEYAKNHAKGKKFEMQKLYGMGDELGQYVIENNIPLRIYAPVGGHKELLPYLIRRILENGANSSFVSSLYDQKAKITEKEFDPFQIKNEDLFVENYLVNPEEFEKNNRKRIKGIDVHCFDNIEKVKEILSSPIGKFDNDKENSRNRLIVKNPANFLQDIGYVKSQSKIDKKNLALDMAKGQKLLNELSVSERAKILRKSASELVKMQDEFINLLCYEAGKTINDAIAEIQEAGDFLNYYADEAEKLYKNYKNVSPSGFALCISPWNFPLAIFIGQVAANLAVGNGVICKPAEQTPLIANKMISILHKAGIPKKSLMIFNGQGHVIGKELCKLDEIANLCFTGSTETAKKIEEELLKNKKSKVNFIAETGGINSFIVTPTSLIEQAVENILQSAFQSAGQRCSATRLVCVEETIYNKFVNMLAGATDSLECSNPDNLMTDLGPVIDVESYDRINSQIKNLCKDGKLINNPKSLNKNGYFIHPHIIEINDIKSVKEEIFGPVIMVYKYKYKDFKKLIEEINAFDYGLTIGINTRLDAEEEIFSQHADIGNIYINRNQIGALVGIQPFGGHNKSGTGPKAGGENYLLRLVRFKKSAERNKDKNISIKKFITTSFDDLEKEKYENEIKNIKQNYQPQIIQQKILEGPTGERNIYYLFNRGLVVCLDTEYFFCKEKNKLKKEKLIKNNFKLLKKACDTKNIPLLLLPEIIASEFIEKYQDEYKFKSIITKENIPAYLFNNLVDAYLINSESVIYNDFKCFIGKNIEIIAPLYTIYDDDNIICKEKTVTINISAYGGDYELLRKT